ncbi:MAG TPA: YbhB/YbcL family Raf kinase inhibitor-like protein [Deltaproteobacteria bacterium]|nr:YbhB/YbcL family Raf kinase inhibitor-like protein [Deltaproteobacteria bacterium]
MKKGLAVSVLTAAVILVCAISPAAAQTKGGVSMELSSPAFSPGAAIPAKYTCDGRNVSPPLEWSGLPEGTRSVALICDDPDAPAGTWVHWVYYDLVLETQDLPEDIEPMGKPAAGGTQGVNDFGNLGYGGPCPPSGTHRYFFKVYALDTELGLPAGTTKEELLDVMKGHILDHAEMIGRYKRR